ncbi:MAG: hypothetical protein K9K21_02755 [Desulfotignum sp.]|nr:hypothetical protein [Desulfotignum sp.]
MKGQIPISSLHRPISVKLFAFFFISMLIAIIPLFFLAHHSIKKLGRFADTANTRQIRKMADDYLTAMAREKAQKYDELFLRIKTGASFLAVKAGEAYQALDAGRPLPGSPPPMVRRPDNHIFYAPESEPVITAFWGSDHIPLSITSELHALAGMDPFLIHAKKMGDQSLAAHIITITGIGKYYTRDPEARKNCFNLPRPDKFDIRDGEPVTTFTGRENPDYRPRWTRLYKDDVIEGLMMTATAPILDARGRFRGIAGIDVPLDNIISNLSADHPEPLETAHDGTCCFTFLMGPGGELIFFPFSHLERFGLEMDLSPFKYSKDTLSLNLKDSAIPEVTNAAQKILDNPSLLMTLTITDQTYVMASHRLHQTGWHIVLANSEKQLLSSVFQTRQALDQTLSGILNNFLQYSVFIFMAALICIYAAVRIFIRPIRQMVFQLNRSQEKEKTHAASLATRTDQLRQLNEHLVYCEEIQRKAIASDLHDSIAQTLSMGISRIKNIRESNLSPKPDEIHEIQLTLEQSVREVRALIYKLSPPILDDFDIDIAIGFLVEETNAQKKTCFDYINHVKEPVPLKHALKVTLYRAVNELLTNIRKHAGTQKARVRLWTKQGYITLEVKDQGAGMDVQKTMTTQDCGFGLYSLSERIQNFGGSMKIESTPGQGTKITITAPVQTKKGLS